jgi:glycosyltransferase involved in cell wall biosynthesis
MYKRGYSVSILNLNVGCLDNFPFNVPIIRKQLCDYFTKTEPKWFTLDKSIHQYSKYKHNIQKLIDKTDIAIATSVETARETVELFPCKKVYFIQDYENWHHDKDYVNKTFHLDMRHIVVSDWLKDVVDKNSTESSLVIKNPISTDEYTSIVRIDKRKKHTIGILYHEGEYKGFKYSYQALKILKNKYPDLEVISFGTFDNPGFPDWVKFFKNATKEQTIQIYNSVQVFLCGSVEEGYGLTGLEAMSCGAALVSSRYRGVLEYGIDGFNCILCPVKDPKALAEGVSYLFDNESKRLEISKNGIFSAKKFDWKIAEDKFDEALKKEFYQNT